MLDFFESEHVQAEFEKILFDLKDCKSKNREIVFVIILLGLLPFSPRRSLVSDICSNALIYNSDFINSQVAKTLLSFKGGHVEISSGILSKYMLNKYFSGREIVDKMIEIVSHFNEIKNGSHVNESIFKELLRFKNINFMLPEKDENRNSNLRNYFNRLKTILIRLEKNPHFWLQYGMTVLFMKEFNLAKKYFENAYGAAKNTPNYDTKYIDNQMARWHLEFGIVNIYSSETFSNLQTAYKLLASQEVDYYFCKQAMFFEDYFKILAAGQTS